MMHAHKYVYQTHELHVTHELHHSKACFDCHYDCDTWFACLNFHTCAWNARCMYVCTRASTCTCMCSVPWYQVHENFYHRFLTCKCVFCMSLWLVHLFTRSKLIYKYMKIFGLYLGYGVREPWDKLSEKYMYLPVKSWPIWWKALIVLLEAFNGCIVTVWWCFWVCTSPWWCLLGWYKYTRNWPRGSGSGHPRNTCASERGHPLS